MPKRKLELNDERSRDSSICSTNRKSTHRENRPPQLLRRSFSAPGSELSKRKCSRVPPSPAIANSAREDVIQVALLDRKRRCNTEPIHAAERPCKRLRKRVPTDPTQTRIRKEHSILPGDHNFEKLKSQVEVAEAGPSDLPKRSVNAENLGVSKKDKAIKDPIRHWVEWHTWPVDFAKCSSMAHLNVTKKRRRPADEEYHLSSYDECQSYTQIPKTTKAPTRDAPTYVDYIRSKGLYMDLLAGSRHVSQNSIDMCNQLKTTTNDTIKKAVFPEAALRDIMHSCHDRNEAMITRDITPNIIPPIAGFKFRGNSFVEHICDEVNALWNAQCILEGSRPRPDLALGLSPSAFTEAELGRLNTYQALCNRAKVTDFLYFPFLLCEVKRATVALEVADRQNMHSSSIALNAVLKLEQEADKYRSEKKFPSLNGQILVFSLSHNHMDLQLYGHYALTQNDEWTYHRHKIGHFCFLTDGEDLVAIRRFVQNVFRDYVPTFIKRLKDAIAMLPEPRQLSCSGTSMLLTDSYSLNSQNLTATRVSGTSKRLRTAMTDKKLANLIEANEKLSQQLEQQRQESLEEKQTMKQSMEGWMEQQRQASMEEKQRMERWMEQQRQERLEEKQAMQQRMEQQRQDSLEEKQRLQLLIQQLMEQRR